MGRADRPTASGKLEMDWFNGDGGGAFAESRALPRIRLAWVRFDWATTWLLLGQAWDLISPLFPMVNSDTVMWNVGNLGDRRPQLQFGWQPGKGERRWSVAVSAGEGGAVDNVRDPTLGTLRGADAAQPLYEARAGYSEPWKGRRDRFQVGVWGHHGRQDIDKPIGGRRGFSTHSLGADLQLPIARWLTLKTERWEGSNLSDVRGGIGQNLNATGQEIKSSGGFEELQLKLTERYTLGLGHTEDHPGFGQVGSRGRVDNHSLYAANRYKPGGRTEIGFDWIHWETHFRGLTRGLDNRLTLYVQQNF
jgi:hypothetical protein